MVKVCHMTSVHHSHDTRIFYKECTSLAKAGYDVYLVAPGLSRREQGVGVIGVGEKPHSRIKRMIVMVRRVFSVALELDCEIYHLHDPELLRAGIKLKKLGKKVIYDSHENYPAQISNKTYLPRLVRNLISTLYRRYETYCVKRFDAVVFPCKIEGKDIFENRAKRTVFLDNYPLLDEVFDGETNPRAQDPFTVCYAGGLTHNRGITHLTKAVYQSGAKLLLAGRFNSKKYQTQLQTMKENECVDLLGQLSRNEVLNVYSRSSVGAATLLRVGQYGKTDNLPTKVLEYMSAGLPVIITDYPYARKVIEKYHCGICVEPDNVEQISETISFLKDNPTIAFEMGQNGRNAVSKEFIWEKEAEKLLNLYDTLSLS